MKTIEEIIRETGLDTSIISDKECPSAGQEAGAHNFRVIEVGRLCNCTIWMIILVKLPWIKFQSARSEVLIDLRRQ